MLAGYQAADEVGRPMSDARMPGGQLNITMKLRTIRLIKNNGEMRAITKLSIMLIQISSTHLQNQLEI